MSELNDMTCAELADVAAELALGVLTGRERAVAIAHLDACDGCREHVRQLMATGEQLRELLPAAEPPAGFETRVLARLGLPVFAPQEAAPQEAAPQEAAPQEAAQPEAAQPEAAQDYEDDDEDDAGGRQAGQPRTAVRTDVPRHRRTSRDTTRQGAGQPGAPETSPDGARPDSARPGGARPGGPRPHGTRPGGTRRPGPGRMRRMLAAAGVGLAVIVAGLGGWRIGVTTTPAAAGQTVGPLSAATLFTSTHHSVGQVFRYSGTPSWLYMSVEMGSGSGSGTVTCQVIGKDGRVTTIGSFRLADGYGAWGSPDPGYLGELSGARLVADNGTVIATGTFAG